MTTMTTSSQARPSRGLRTRRLSPSVAVPRCRVRRCRPGPAARRQAMSTLITFVEPGMFTAVPAVITTRSPLATMPLARAASSEVAPEILDVVHLRDLATG